MAVVGIWKRPIVQAGGANPTCLTSTLWHWPVDGSVRACPLQLLINGELGYILAVALSGGVRRSTLCGSGGSYVTFSSDDRYFCVDVWKAYRDGFWTSSLAVQVYGYSLFGAGISNLNVGRASRPLGGSITSTYSALWPSGSSPTCPTTLVKTVTVTASGGISVA